MVDHPIGCGQRPVDGQGEEWEHWMYEYGDYGPAVHHCDWTIDAVRRGGYHCKWGTGAPTETDGIFHKACLQREGYIW